MDTPFTMGISLMCVWCADASGGRVHGNGMGRCDKRARGGHPHPPTDTLPFPNFNSARPPTTCPSRSASWTRRRRRRPRWPRPRREEGDSERVEVSRVWCVCVCVLILGFSFVRVHPLCCPSLSFVPTSSRSFLTCTTEKRGNNKKKKRRRASGAA